MKGIRKAEITEALKAEYRSEKWLDRMDTVFAATDYDWGAFCIAFYNCFQDADDVLNNESKYSRKI